MTSLSARMLTGADAWTRSTRRCRAWRAPISAAACRCWCASIEQRSRQPGANLYLIADPNGRILSGNVESLEPGVLEIEGWTDRPFTYQRYGEGSRRTRGNAAEPAERRHAVEATARGDRRSCSGCPTR